MTRTVARLLAESLEAHDVDQVYCVPGESYVGLTSALIERNSIRVVVCRHEGGAGYMAVADGRLRDRAGVAMVSRGPGLSNAMVSLHSAYHDATPVVMLVGQVERKDFGRLALQEQNYSRLLSDVTKLVIEVNESEQASEAIARAFHVAESGTPGPVAVILPEDIFDEDTNAELDPARPRVVAGPRTEDLDRLVQLLAQAERPLVLVGGALLADAVHDKAVFADLNRVSEGWVLPISPTHRRPQLFDATHPNFGGYMGIRVPPALIGEMKRRFDGRIGRAHDRHRQPVLQLPDRAAAAIAVRPYLARSPMRWAASGGPILACRAVPTRSSKPCCAVASPPMRAGAAAGSMGCMRSTANCWRRNGSPPATA
jgi:acetolactate synthase-1/2/3 large subunit